MNILKYQFSFNFYVFTLLWLTVHSYFLSGNTTKSLPKDFASAIKDIVVGLRTNTLTIVRSNLTDIRSEDIFEIMCVLSENNIQVISLDLTTQENKDRYYRFLKQGLDTSVERTSLILCEPLECENLLFEITINNFIHRSMLYIFFWPHGEVSKLFLSGIKEAIRVAVITNPRHAVNTLRNFSDMKKLAMIEVFQKTYRQTDYIREKKIDIL